MFMLVMIWLFMLGLTIFMSRFGVSHNSTEKPNQSKSFETLQAQQDHPCIKKTLLPIMGSTQYRALTTALIARFMGPTWGSSGTDRTQVGPMLAP